MFGFCYQKWIQLYINILLAIIICYSASDNYPKQYMIFKFKFYEYSYLTVCVKTGSSYKASNSNFNFKIF